MTTYSITTYKVKLQLSEAPAVTTNTPLEALSILRAIYADLDADQEHFTILAVNNKNQTVGFKTVSSGCMDSAPVDPKLLWRAALTLGGTGVIVAHNHPSGDPEPSSDDRTITAAIKKAASLLGFRLLDHIILGHGERYVSLKTIGLL